METDGVKNQRKRRNRKGKKVGQWEANSTAKVGVVGPSHSIANPELLKIAGDRPPKTLRTWALNMTSGFLLVHLLVAEL